METGCTHIHAHGRVCVSASIFQMIACCCVVVVVMCYGYVYAKTADYVVFIICSIVFTLYGSSSNNNNTKLLLDINNNRRSLWRTLSHSDVYFARRKTRECQIMGENKWKSNIWYVGFPKAIIGDRPFIVRTVLHFGEKFFRTCASFKTQNVF